MRETEGRAFEIMSHYAQERKREREREERERERESTDRPGQGEKKRQLGFMKHS